jgi:cysteine-rich repeat protein
MRVVRFSRTTTRWALLLAASVLSSACGSDPEPGGTVCGGVVRDGECYQLCEDKLCVEGNACVFPQDRPEGYCTLPCQNNDGCPYGFACYAGVPNAAGEAGNYCLTLGLPDNGKPAAACTSTSDCDNLHGLFCFEGACSFPCSSVFATCPDGSMCKGDPEANAEGPAGYCVPAPADFGVDGRYGTDCPFGDSQCDEAGGYVCLGAEGASDAYCSKPDGCQQDADCPSGYWCGAIRSAAADADDIDFTKQPKTCLRRGFCHPCETDMDCGHTEAAICVPDKQGEKFCSTPCAPGTNACVIGASCEDVGDGRTACRPDVGACYSKDPKGCDPCRIDPDCGPNAMCVTGKWGYKPGMNWCSTPCGANSEHGKASCPVAPNGLEMLCLDENMIGLGGPFDATAPNYLYKHCYAPFTVDNTEYYPGVDPPNGACGNGKVEPGEECDDANATVGDGCVDCKVTAECTFTISEPNEDGNPVIAPAPDQVKVTAADPDPAMPYVISMSFCRTFKVEGALETAGDIDVIAVMLPNEGTMFVDTYTSTPGTCTADLVTEARAWKDGETLGHESFLDLTVPCEKLSDAPEDYASTGYACPGSPTHLGCGTCDGPGVCGVCDDDSGQGDCTRMQVSTATSFSGYPIYFDGRYKVIRVYARDPGATVGNFIVIGTRFTAQAYVGPSLPVALGCY